LCERKKEKKLPVTEKLLFSSLPDEDNSLLMHKVGCGNLKLQSVGLLGESPLFTINYGTHTI